jgi:hypothetical protein
VEDGRLEPRHIVERALGQRLLDGLVDEEADGLRIA